MENKQSRQEFMSRLSKIKEGATEEQLLRVAGNPDERSGAKWYYHWSESGMGGLYAYFSLTVENGVVTKIERGGGCNAVK